MVRSEKQRAYDRDYQKKRYYSDPDYRRRLYEWKIEWQRKNRDKYNARKREKYASNPIERERARQRANDYRASLTDEQRAHLNKLKRRRSRARYHNEEEFRKKSIARATANNQIPIPEGQICERCKESPATQRHHEDYSKPLEVEFVCKGCHV